MTASSDFLVFDEVPAWSGSDYAKIGKQSKWFASDAGLVANLLGWDESTTYYDSDESGKLVETWVHHELAAQVDLLPDVELTQYRDSDKREIDFVLENAKGNILGVEVKAGTVSGHDFHISNRYHPIGSHPLLPQGRLS